ncbi:MAG TPA: signal recognition particle receptor subunit alpha, partial [Acidimicrobiia bacterium]|nr:signal recognition particle receptor subunit alpha [Acidimicrobiia bacterium]
MALVLVLVVIVLLALGATLVATVSRRSHRQMDAAERQAVTQPKPAPRPTPERAPQMAGEPGDVEIVLPPGDDVVVPPEAGVEVVPEVPVVEESAEPEPALVRPRLRDRLGKARALLAGYFGDLRGRTVIDDEVWEELEEALIRADVGVTVTERILDDLRRRAKEAAVATPSDLLDLLKADMVEALRSADRSLSFEPGQPNVWMFVGVNGVGKTTSIGKIAQREAAAGRRVVMAAADTFRAAAAEQLQLWSQRVGADLVRGQDGADPGSVV